MGIVSKRLEEIFKFSLHKLLLLSGDLYVNNLNKGVKVIKKNSNYIGIQTFSVDYELKEDKIVRFNRWRRVKRSGNMTSYSEPDLQILIKFRTNQTVEIYYTTPDAHKIIFASWDDCLQDILDELDKSLRNYRL